MAETTEQPQAVDIERQVLGGLLVDGREAFEVIAALIRPQTFYDTRHNHIFKAIREVHQTAKPIDIITVSEQLKKNKVLDEVGGSAYLAELSMAVTSSANVETYAHILLEKSLLRHIIKINTVALDTAKTGAADPFDILRKQEEEILQIHTRIERSAPQPSHEAIQPVIEQIQNMNKNQNPVVGIPSKFVKFNNWTGGYQQGLYVIGGRPGSGKSAFMTSEVRQQAAKVPVGIFSLEMSIMQQQRRLIIAESGVSIYEMRRGNFSTQQQEALSQAYNAIGSLNLFIDEQPDITIQELRSKAVRLKHKHGIQIIWIDYLQLMRADAAESRERAIAEITRGLRALSKILSIPIVALSQIGRGAEGTEGKRPTVAHLRESGAIENDADLVGLLYRPEQYRIKEYELYPNAPAVTTDGLAILDIAKQREGQTGDIDLHYEKSLARFDNPEPQHPKMKDEKVF